MNLATHWPDLAIVALLFITTLRGFKHGLIAELGGFVALGVAIWAAIVYPGRWDAAISSTTGLSPGSSHVVGMGLYATVAYVVVSIVAVALSRIAKLPFIGIANGALGAVVGLVKGMMLVWLLLYFVLFLPLDRGVRADLRQSPLAMAANAPNKAIDARVEADIPWFVRPVMAPMFARHNL